MADYAALQEQNKLAALRAMAAGNPDPYAASSGVISGAQDEALTRFAGDAAGRQAPQGSISQGEAMIRGPADAALAGIGQSQDAYSAELTALHNEAAHPAVPPQSFSSGGAGGTSAKKAKQGPGYNQYGGYQTAAEYENAVLGRASQAEEERKSQVEADAAAQAAAEQPQTTEDRIAAYNAQQAHNQAVVGGPGAVIHGIGWKDNPVSWSPTPAAPPPARNIGVAAMPSVGPGGMLYPAPQPAPPRLSFADRPTQEVSNYSPEQVAMLRGAADQTYGRVQARDRWAEGARQGAQDLVGQIEDPRNMYEFAQRAAINEFGGDPYEAIGRFSPEWGMKTYAIPKLSGPNDYQAAQNEGLERQANEAQGFGAYTDTEIRGKHADIVRASPDYETGRAVAEAQLNSLAGGPKSDKPVTLDGLRTALAQAGVDPTAAMQVITDYGRLYPGQAYYNLPEEVSTAAAQAGNPQG